MPALMSLNAGSTISGYLSEPQTLFLQNGVSHPCFIEWQGNHMTSSEKSLAQCVRMVGVITNMLIKIVSVSVLR